MVPDRQQERDVPSYSLTQVHELAAQGSVRYGGRTVQKDATNLSYQLEDICRCLLLLRACHFDKSIGYGEEETTWMDVYRITCSSPSDDDDALYIKLKLVQDRVVILGSFHLHR